MFSSLTDFNKAALFIALLAFGLLGYYADDLHTQVTDAQSDVSMAREELNSCQGTSERLRREADSSATALQAAQDKVRSLQSQISSMQHR